MSEPAISIKNLSKVYKLYDRNIDRMKEALHPFKKKYHRDFYALEHINLEVKKGEILGIMGRNGAGKSTLLKIISGILLPTAGTCTVNGKVSALLELSSGFNPDLTGMENIYLSGILGGYSRKQMEEKIDDIFAFAEVGDFINQPLKTYSNGMKARLGFAAAVHIEPEILVLDEVLSVGDVLFKRKCYARMETLFQSGCTVLFVSHSPASIDEICTRAILLERGGLILEGPPKLVTSQYQRFLFSGKGNETALRKEIISLNNDEKFKRKFKSGKEKKKTPTSQKQEPLFIPDLKPKSTTQIKNYDVEIADVHIETLEGKRVNMLVMNEYYYYSYRVNFNIDAEDVSFGMMIKTEKGIKIGGMALASMKKEIKKVCKGEGFSVRWLFKCNLLENLYYTNAGVQGRVNGSEKREILNKITDAVVFKVYGSAGSGYYGIVNFDQYPVIREL